METDDGVFGGSSIFGKRVTEELILQFRKIVGNAAVHLKDWQMNTVSRAFLV